MPTFQFFKRGIQIDQLGGANPQELENKIKKCSQQQQGSGAIESSRKESMPSPVPGYVRD